MFNKTSRYFSILNNKPLASWVAHITRDFLTCYEQHCENERAVFKIWYPVFDTHLTATLTIFTKKDSKYAGVSLNWSLAIIITEPVPLKLVPKQYASSIFPFAMFWL